MYTQALEAWPSFATEVLGLEQVASGPEGELRFRNDDAMWRISIHPNDSNDIGYFGWAVSHEHDLEEYSKKLTDRGIEVLHGDNALAAQRGVRSLIHFHDLNGVRHELVYAQNLDVGTFRPGRNVSGFVTGAQGLGHAVFMVPDLASAHDFFSNVLGFKISDVSAGRFKANFYHLEGRHHALALAQGPEGMVGFNHMMLEVASLRDVGMALDIVQAREIPLTLTLGQHSNDQMTSFYVSTPSGFHIEYGTGGIIVDDATWVPAQHFKASIWGHHFTEFAQSNPPAVFRPVP